MNNGSACPSGYTGLTLSKGARAVGQSLDPALSHASPRVLFVDDEPSVLDGVRVGLRKSPYVICTTTDPQRALEMFREEPFDVIVADQMMPRMQGSELLAIVAREFPAAGRIVLTGHGTVETAVQAVNYGRVARLLLKPCPPEELREAIERVLASRAHPVATEVRVASRRRIFLVNRRGSGRAAVADHAASRPASRTELPGDHRGVRGYREGSSSGWEASELLVQAHKLVALSDPRSALAYEISSRLRTQTGTLHTIGNFIDSTRQSVLHPSVDTWVIRNILETLREYSVTLQQRGLAVSLNIAWQSLAKAEFVQILNRELSRSGLASRLLIEIRQQVLLKALRANAAPLCQLLQSDCFKWGARLCIDGVGAEIAAVPSLRDLPIAAVKIDNRHVRDILTNPNSESVVRGVVEWARGLQIDIAATGVETISIAERLRSLDVRYGQGAAFGAPEPLALALARLHH